MKRRRPTFDQATDREEIDLTPLIDVVFVVLIFFILVAPMVEIDRIQLAQAPNRSAADTVSPSPLSIHVCHNNTVRINQRPIAHDQIGVVLKALHRTNPEAHPQLYQDRTAPFGTYQLVKNAVEEAGYAELEVILKPQRLRAATEDTGGL